MVLFSSGSDFIIATSNRLICQMHTHTQTFVQRIPTHLPVSLSLNINEFKLPCIYIYISLSDLRVIHQLVS